MNFDRIFSEVRSAEKECENEILKMENEYDTKRNILRKKYSTEVENTYACLTWEAPRKNPAERKTDQQAVQRAAQLPAQRRNSNCLSKELLLERVATARC